MACKLCGGKTKKIELLCTNLKIMGAHFPETEVYISVCEKCGLVQADMSATQADLFKYYVSPVCTPFRYQENYGEQAANEYFEHLYNSVKEYITPESYILDVGGSWGEFAEYMEKRGYKNFFVADPSEQCVEAVRAQGGNAVLTDSTVMEKEQFPGKFDLIFYNHTMEHIYDLEHTMLNTMEILKDDGIVFIDVPNVEKYVEFPMAPYYFLTYEHVLHFSDNDLDNLANKYGLKRIGPMQHYVKLHHYPSCFAIYQKGKTDRKLNYSDKAEKAMRAYLEYCHNKLSEITDELKETQEPLILWGIGASTTQLLQGFDGCNVVQLIDKNPLRQGIEYTVSGKKMIIQDPEMVCPKATVVILPYMYAESIKKQIRDMRISNKIVSLCF
jgi:SAM-dependent methyltransferase